MNAFLRHSAKGWITAIALSALVLTGCGQNPSEDLGPATAAESSSSSSSATSAKPAEASPSARDDRTDTGGKPSAAAPSSAPSPEPSSEPTRRTAAPADPKATSAPTANASEDTAAPALNAPFAGTEQFVTISKAWSSNGRTYLSVRSAQKKINTRFDTWEITPGTGSYTTVPMAENGQVLLAVPVRGEVPGTSRAELLGHSPAQLVTLINRLDPALSGGIGYDLIFDGTGRVTGLTSLYRP
ncbi:hypothetical protein N7925_19295 [Streptomyces sp. CA-278952]|uniref:hypothetical protein n=1 Tax=Streptomyces sp. CA-278952 TaxID=2980556 RepID=UPI00236834CB|nr:hypothetical protein [Streptomyces sp. CA-278952]WDG30325.1 hypothetical protein N7925_19295 [Streptomyces sp. CA-278952]